MVGIVAHLILQRDIHLGCRSPIRRISEVMLLVFVTSSLWFLFAYASPCKNLPPKVHTASSVCSSSLLLCMCSMQRRTSEGRHCTLCLRLLFALAHVLHAETYFPRSSLFPLFVASLCSCACAQYKDVPLQAVTAPSICSFCLFLHTRCCHQHWAVMLFALHYIGQTEDCRSHPS